MKLKVCGMRDLKNIKELAGIMPDFMGFIFYEKSSRRFHHIDGLDKLQGIKKVGVFVDEDPVIVLNRVREYTLDYVQLHGAESPEYCEQLRQSGIGMIKAFPIGPDFDFTTTRPYEGPCDYFLFDNKGQAPGGTGIKFDWRILEQYHGKTGYLLSGGIQAADVSGVSLLGQKDKRLVGVDINSRFEISPGLKDIDKIRAFKNALDTQPI